VEVEYRHVQQEYHISVDGEPLTVLSVSIDD